jgi:hypothetical protein
VAENVVVLGTLGKPGTVFPLAAALAVLENYDGEKPALHRGITKV